MVRCSCSSFIGVFQFLEGTAKVLSFYYSNYLSDIVSGHGGVG